MIKGRWDYPSLYIQGTFSKTEGGLDLPLFVSWDLPIIFLGCLGH